MERKFRTEPEPGAGEDMLRIYALRAFGNVAEGERGGLLEDEANLSQEGDSWVFEGALVYQGARIFQDAQIFGHAHIFQEAHIFGHAQVFGEASIYGRAHIFGDAKIFGHAQITGVARLGMGAVCKRARDVLVMGPLGSRNDHTTFVFLEHGVIVYCGCWYGSLEEFIQRVKEKHGNSIPGREYQAVCGLVEKLRKGRE